MLLAQSEPENTDRIIALLRGRQADLDQEPPDIRVDYVLLLSDVTRKRDGLSAALETVNSFPNAVFDTDSKLLVQSEMYRLAGSVSEAVDLARKLLGAMQLNVSSHLATRTAVLAQALGLHGEALKLWKHVVSHEYVSDDTYRAIDCAKRCGDSDYVFTLCEMLRNNGIWDKYLFETEINFRVNYNDATTATQLLTDFIARPADPDYLPFARFHRSKLGVYTHDLTLVEQDAELLPSAPQVSPEIGKDIAMVLRYGAIPMKAVEYAYNLVRLYWDSKYAHEAMTQVLLPEGPEIPFEEPDRVQLGSAVLYIENDTKDERWHIIEDSTLMSCSSLRKEFSPDHFISRALLGKKAGDSFCITRNTAIQRTATIKDLWSKYKYRFNVSFDELSTRFADKASTQKIPLVDESGNFDVTALENLAKKDQESIENLEHVYATELCPLYLVARARKKVHNRNNVLFRSRNGTHDKMQHRNG